MVKNTIKVYGRIKRTSKSFKGNYNIRKIREHEEIIFNSESGDYGIYKTNKNRFRFNSILDENTTQPEAFDVVAKPVVNSVLEGYNGTIFAYGQTGSGKTYSMTGAAEYESRGIIPRTIQYIFEYIKNSTPILYNIYISYLEIYNEIGYDLLNPRQRATCLEDLPRINLLEDAKGQLHLRNLGVISVASEREAMCLLFLGDTNRTIAETPMNMYSSRSHCIFTVHVSATMTEDGRVRRSKLHLVDLAGSERIQKTGITGPLVTEAKQINLSLHYLEQVIIALSDEKRAHVPYRNSLMTSVLKDSLGGNCLTAMLATMSPDPKNYTETVSTCKFAQRVAMVSSDVHINEDEDPEIRIDALKIEIENLKKELCLYKSPNGIKLKIQEKKDLTSQEYIDCEKQILTFIQNTSDEFPIDENINYLSTYFKLFKTIIKSQMESIESNKAEDKPLENLIKQKDNEISILVHMLSKEKLKNKEIEMNTIDEFMSNSGSNQEINMNFDLQANEKQAFELFLRNEENKTELNNCMFVLIQKIEQAKTVANIIKMCKNNIMSLKVKLRENINNVPEALNNLMSQLKSQQDIYRENIIHLRNLKTETDHLNHAFQQEKLRIMNRFKEWRAHENMKKKSQHIMRGNPFGSNTNMYQNIQEDNSLYNEGNMNTFSCENITMDPDLYLSQLNQKDNVPNFSIDTFPSVYDESGSLQQFEETRMPPEIVCNNQALGISTNNSCFLNPYIFAPTLNYAQSNLNEFQHNTNYLNQAQMSSSSQCNTMENQYVYNNYSESTLYQNNFQNHNNYSLSQPKFSNSYTENNHIPEKLYSNPNMFKQKATNRNTDNYITSVPSTSGTNTLKVTNRIEEDTDFLNSVPLTGDPEVDEEILAFYRAKQCISSK